MNEPELKDWLIQVEAVPTLEFTRTYRVKAVDAQAALEAYQNDSKEVEWVSDSDDNSYECEEDGNTARVYTDDGTMTLELDAADSLP